jgi:hypothetical protein
VIEILATLDRVPGAAVATRHDPEATLTYSQGSPAAGSRFAIRRPHARGDLGQISVALDAELNREVALKGYRPDCCRVEEWRGCLGLAYLFRPFRLPVPH